MDHMDAESLIDILKVVIDIRQHLIVLLQRLEQDTLALEKLFGHNDVRHALQHETPSGGVAARVRRAEEHEAVRRHVDGAVVLVVGGAQVVGVQQRALDEDAAEAVAHPDDGVLVGALTAAVQRQAGDERLRVLVDKVVAGTAVVAARVHVGVVPVDQHVGLQAAQRCREEVGRPERAVGRGPGSFGGAVEAVDEDNVDIGIWVRVDGGRFVAGYVAARCVLGLFLT